MKTLRLAAFVALLCPFFAKAQFKLSGVVSEGSKALPGATLKLKGTSIAVSSLSNGNFEFNNLKAGNYTVVASFLGFETQEKSVKIEQNSTLNFNLVQKVFLGEEIVVRGTRASEKSATSFKNVDKEYISRQNFGQDLPFILDNTPGVVVTSDAGAGIGYTGIRIRGSDATRVNVTLNGIPYNDSESQGTFWVNMPDFASSVDNIQIQRGVGTSTNGAGAFGGSLNIQTTAGESEAYGELNNTYGSFGTWKNTVKVGTGPINEKWSFDGRLSRIKSDGFIDRASSNLKSYFLSGAYQGKSELIRVNVFSGTEKTYQAWNGIPESRLRGDIAGMKAYIDRNGLSADEANNLLNSNSRTYNSFTYPDQTDNYFQDHYQLLYAKQVNTKLNVNAALHYTAGKGYYEEFKANQKLASYGLAPVVIGGTTITRTDLVRRRWLDNDFYGFTYGLNYIPNKMLTFNFGGAYNEYKGAHFGQVIYAKYASNGSNDRHYYDNDAFKSDFNSFGKLAINPTEKLSLFADLQFRRIVYNVTGTDKNINALAVSDKLNFFNPKFGINYNLTTTSNFYTSFSVAQKEPSRDDYINTVAGSLPKREKLNNLEIGYRINNKKISGGANVYGMWYKDQLVVTGKINDVGEYFRQNVADSYRMGVELDFSYLLNKNFTLLANASFSENKIKSFTEYIDDYDEGGQMENTYKNTDISFSPKQIISGEILYNLGKSTVLSWQSKYVGSQFLDNTQNSLRKLEGYWINNARIGQNFNLKGLKKVNLALLINNLLNAKYESNGYTYGYQSGNTLTTENFYFAQSGVNLMLSLNLKF